MFKKIIYAFSIALLAFTVSCSNNKPVQIEDDGFVKLINNKFEIDGESFFPMVLNYNVSLINRNNEMWPSSFTGYYNFIEEQNLDKDSCILLLKSDLQMVKDMGFNTIRVVGIGEVLDTLKQEDISKYLGAIKELYTITNDVDLKVIFLLPMWPKKPELFEKYKPLLTQEKDNNNILAYDFFNEPLYFDTVQGQRRKKDVYRITRKWKEYLHENSPKHLLTVGLAGSKEVGVWDPNVLDIDFISFHPYEYAENMVMREIYWYSKYVKKPWIIGETSYSADNDSIPYSEQTAFAKKILQQTINGGGIGFSWWQYKDVEWGDDDFHSNYMGLLTREGTTQTSDKNLKVIGTLKDAVKVFQDFKYERTDTVAVMPYNYYNSYNHKNYKVIGMLYNSETNTPVVGATIISWYKDWSKSFITYTKEDGSFELNGEFELYHIRISATEYSTFWKKTDFDGEIIRDKSPTIVSIGTQFIEPADID